MESGLLHMLPVASSSGQMFLSFRLSVQSIFVVNYLESFPFIDHITVRHGRH